MPYSPQEKAGLRFLKAVLTSVGYPEETTIDQIFFRKDGDKVTPVFSAGSPTVDDILEADIHEAYEEPVISFAGAEANAMWESAISAASVRVCLRGMSFLTTYSRCSRSRIILCILK